MKMKNDILNNVSNSIPKNVKVSALLKGSCLDSSADE